MMSNYSSVVRGRLCTSIYAAFRFTKRECTREINNPLCHCRRIGRNFQLERDRTISTKKSELMFMKGATVYSRQFLFALFWFISSRKSQKAQTPYFGVHGCSKLYILNC